MLDGSGRRAVRWADPSSGVVDYRWVFGVLEDAGYAGTVAAEYEAVAHDGSLVEARDGLRQRMAFFASQTG